MKTTKFAFDRTQDNRCVTVYVLSYDELPQHGFSVSAISESRVSVRYRSHTFSKYHDTRKIGVYGGGFKTAYAAAEAAFALALGEVYGPFVGRLCEPIP